MPTQILTPWSDMMRTTYEKDAKDYVTAKKQKYSVIPTWQYHAMSRYEKQESDGDTNLKCLRDMLKTIDENGYNRSDAQRLFINHFTAACLNQLYKGTDLYKNLEKIMREFSLDEVRSDVIVTTPRRWGKTWSVAIFCAAFIMSQIKARIFIYSTCRATANAMLMLIYQIVMAVCKDKSVIQVYTLQDCRLRVSNSRGSWGEVCSSSSNIDVNPFFSITKKKT